MVTRDFTKWVADKQKDEGFLLKQQRLWREERAADDERQRGDNTNDKTGQNSSNAADKK